MIPPVNTELSRIIVFSTPRLTTVAEVVPVSVKFGVVPSVISVAPVTVRVPLSEISPVVAVAFKSPPMFDVAKSRPASFTNVTSPPDPLVARAIVPSTARLPMLISPLLTSLVAMRLPPTVTVPLSVIPVA